jgi:5-methyltetrahydrofolate--homocysteine methyltransferase
MNIRDLLNKRRIYFDGGMGTLLQKRGLTAGEKPENWNITRADDITDIHLAYLNAGSNVITTNTFGASCLKFTNLEEIISSAIDDCRKIPTPVKDIIKDRLFYRSANNFPI